jgi:lipopolysaccharide/colanic/teichoic acid biosynthesis glycosyltransferase
MFLLREKRTAALGQDTPARRVVDVVVAGSALLLLWPLLVLIGLLIRTTSAGPGIYRQRRVGRGGTSFMIWKFRTMTVDAAEHGAAVSGRADPRITGVGRLLRTTRLDELPQLVNVLRGEMTLIGPRPEVPRFVARYTPAEQQLLAVRPGVIGPGALLFAVEQSDELDVAEDADEFYVRHHLHPKLALDLAYLQDRRIARDLRLVGAALRVVVRC